MVNDSLSQLNLLPYFTLESYKQIAGIDNARTQTARMQLVRWHKTRKILRIKRGVYLTNRFYATHHQDTNFLPAISSIINSNSYVSATYILQKKAILTEITYPVTAVTTKNTRTYKNDLGVFVYQHITETLYTGFTQEEYHGIIFYQATTAKALFDYLYLRPLSELARRKRYDIAEELRLNLLELSLSDQEEFANLIEESGIPKMQDIFNNFKEYIWRP